MDLHQYFKVNKHLTLHILDSKGLIEALDYIKTTKNSWTITGLYEESHSEEPCFDIIKVEPKMGESIQKFDYKELQGYVGGLIQVVPVVNDQYDDWKDFVILVNEEGILLNLPMSPVSRGGNYFKGHTLFGNVLIVHESEWE